MQLEDLRIGADVISQDRHRLGTLSRFVLQRETMTLTHVVVDTGILRSGEPLWKGGWGLNHDRIVPLAAVAAAFYAATKEIGLFHWLAWPPLIEIVLAVVAVATAAVALGIGRLRAEFKMEASLPAHHPFVQIDQRIREEFGGRSVVA